MGKNKASKKQEEKKKDKIFEDKTFGLKNKKSKKVQNFIKTVEQQVYNKNPRKDAENRNKKKEEKKKQQEEMALLGFLQKSLENNKKKKEEEKKAMQEMEEEKVVEDDKFGSINIYADPREPDPTRSNKVCDHFLDACEKNVYGWRWQCPNGGAKCQYAHALPEGYMLKSTMEALMAMQREDNADRAIEYKIEEERAKLNADK